MIYLVSRHTKFSPVLVTAHRFSYSRLDMPLFTSSKPPFLPHVPVLYFTQSNFHLNEQLCWRSADGELGYRASGTFPHLNTSDQVLAPMAKKLCSSSAGMQGRTPQTESIITKPSMGCEKYKGCQ